MAFNSLIFLMLDISYAVSTRVEGWRGGIKGERCTGKHGKDVDVFSSSRPLRVYYIL